jgi:hypothetical protein
VQGSAVDKLLAHVQKDPPPISQLRGDVPPEVAAILARMMAKAPAERFATPGDVAHALAPFCRPATAGGASEAEAPVAVEMTPAASRPSPTAAGDSGPVDLGELNLQEFPDLLPPLPTDVVSSPRPSRFTTKRGHQTLRLAKHQAAVVSSIALTLAVLIGWVCYPAIRNALSGPDRKGEAM